jgi:hypothetical protein
MRAALISLTLLLMAAPAAAQRSSPPSTTTHTVDYQEPTTKADGTPLQGLKSIRLYWRVDDGPETLVTLPASSIKGGLVRRLVLTVPATSGILSVTLTAIDVAGNESARTAPVTKTIAPAGGKE